MDNKNSLRLLAVTPVLLTNAAHSATLRSRAITLQFMQNLCNIKIVFFPFGNRLNDLKETHTTILMCLVTFGISISAWVDFGQLQMWIEIQG